MYTVESYDKVARQWFNATYGVKLVYKANALKLAREIATIMVRTTRVVKVAA